MPIIEHVFRSAHADKTAQELIQLARTFFQDKQALDVIQRLHYEATGTVIPEEKIHPPQAMAFRRIFCMLKLLATDLEYQIKYGCLKPEAKKVVIDLHRSVIGGDNKMKVLGRNSPEITLISAEMNSERVKDIHCTLDTLFQIDNLSTLNDTLLEVIAPSGMEQSYSL